MKDCKTLGQAARILIPEYFDKIDWNGIWNRKLETGSAFEWAVLAAMIRAARLHGAQVSVPLLDSFQAGEFFILRNEIPLSHGAQAGNSATALPSKSLKDRFFYSLIPKAVFYIHGQVYSVFREGCPYHKIMCGQNYLERTDIIVIPGTVPDGFPRFSPSGNEVEFAYEYGGQQLSGRLRVINSPLIPCRRRSPRGGLSINVTGIVECSVNKSAETAAAQLSRYDRLFAAPPHHPAYSIITGNTLPPLPYDCHTVDLTSENPSSLSSELLKAAAEILKNFSIID